jgi:hypothetical protein
MLLERFSRSAALALALSCGWAAALPNALFAADEERPLPDYDGREPPPSTPGDVLLWVPRIILFPVYVVAEYVIRAPLGFLIAGAERAGVPAWLYDFFTFGAEHQGGLVPTAYADFDFYPSVGLYAFWDNAFFEHHDLRLRGAFGGGDWLAASFSERYHFGADRSDRVALMQMTRQSSLHLQFTLRDAEFFRGGFEEDAVLIDRVNDGELPLPPGYADGYALAAGELSLAFDTRRPRPEPGSGLRLAVDATPASLLGQGGGFLRYGGTAAGFWDINDRRRVLSLGLGASFIEPIDDVAIPFTELVTLGGPGPMRGLYPGRLYDSSAFVAGVAYRWPIWIWLDGALRSEVGNVFGEHLDGFRLGRLRWSGAIGVESNGPPDSAFQVLIGAGSETFESGGEIDSFRFAVGATHGF